jgi:predicted transcriptional regulator
MRTLIDIGDAQIEALDDLSRASKRSRAALIREAVADYLARHRRSELDDSFGLWGDRTMDGLAYQEKLRREW